LLLGLLIGGLLSFLAKDSFPAFSELFGVSWVNLLVSDVVLVACHGCGAPRATTGKSPQCIHSKREHVSEILEFPEMSAVKPKRVGLQFSPPLIMVEYEDLYSKKLYIQSISVTNLTVDQDPEPVVTELRTNFRELLGRTSRKQLRRLISLLQLNSEIIPDKNTINNDSEADASPRRQFGLLARGSSLIKPSSPDSHPQTNKVSFLQYSRQMKQGTL
jgi:hypothetical protein